MKKIMFALMCIAGSMFATAGGSETITNVYDFTASLAVPYLHNGIRTYNSQTFKGLLYVEFVDGEADAMWLVTVNSKTKVTHVTEFTGGFYNLMGKSSKYSERILPTVYCEAHDVDISDNAHELIQKIQFAGKGQLKSVKSTTSSCSFCSGTIQKTSYCNILYSMSGYATGVMDCMCPDDEDWDHTLETELCGVWTDRFGNTERSHYASVFGTWKAKFNSKLSDTKIK